VSVEVKHAVTDITTK